MNHYTSLSSRITRLLAAVTATALTGMVVGAGALSGGVPAAAAEPAQSTARAVSGAELDWAINDESTGGSYFGGCNFLSAGKAGDSGSARLWKESDNFFKASDGNVSVVKPKASGGTEAITWANKCTNASGATIGGKVTSGEDTSSEARVHITGGTGWVDPVTGAAEIAWQGSFTVAYYGGMTYWSATDPILQVQADGTARLTATLSGFGADMDDLEVWKTLPQATVELMTFVDTKAQEGAFSATADYLGVTVASDGGRNAQTARTSENASWWGAFPASFIKYQLLTGQSSYWYTTEGAATSIQPRKVAEDASVSGVVLGAVVDDPQYTEIDTTRVPDPDPGTVDPEIPDPGTGGTGSTDKPDTGTKVSKSFKVTDAQLRWGLNDEANSGAFYGGCNFLSAGVAGNAGSSRTWTESDGLYRATSGKVSIIKPDSTGAYHTATWATKCKDSSGTAVSTARGTSTESLVTIDGGNGTVDPDAGTATISWKGSFTVVFYGGMTYWSVSNPVLTVKKDGTGTLKGTASGYGADMEDTGKWNKLSGRTITLATLSDVDVSGSKGITVVPDYVGVSVKVSNGSHGEQAAKTSTNKAYWGSFPQSFVNFQVLTGQSAYWYTSGGSRDSAKPATELVVSYDASTVDDSGSGKDPDEDDSDKPTATNSLKLPTARPATVAATTAVPVLQTGTGTSASLAQGPLQAVIAVVPQQATTTAAEAAPAADGTGWVAGGALLLGSALTVAWPVRRPKVS